MPTRVTIGVIFYSMTGNVLKLAQAVAEGVEGAEGARAEVRVAPELVPERAIQENARLRRVSEAKAAFPEAEPEDLERFDGFMFGTPTRYGRLSAQLAEFFDRTGDVWQRGTTSGKPAGVFTSTSSVHGGQETTITSTWATLVHLGMIPVGVPYTVEALFDHVPEGGSPYGASSVSGQDADLGPTQRELSIARTHGRRVAELARVILVGRRALAREGVALEFWREPQATQEEAARG